jgi:hypothetical protein
VPRGRASDDPFEDDRQDFVAFEGFTNPDHLSDFLRDPPQARKAVS